MTGHEWVSQELTKGAGRLVGHTIAVVVGLALMFAGIALGVTIVMLPAGIPVGFIGLFIVLWGLFGWAQGRAAPTQPPAPR